MIPQEVFMGILWVLKVQGPEIMSLQLKDMYIWLQFSPTAAKVLIKARTRQS